MCYKGVLKTLMVLFNSAIFLAGSAIMVIGVLVIMSQKNVLGVLYIMKDIPPQLEHLFNAGYLLIAVGAILTIMGFLGCFGACCENKCMLMTFFIVILIVFIIEVVGAVLVLLYQPKVEKLLDEIRTHVAKNIKETYGQNEAITNTWNATMSLKPQSTIENDSHDLNKRAENPDVVDEMECCGYNNYTDFTGSSFVNKASLYPKFCCSTTTKQCDVGNAASEHVVGCFDAVVNLVKSNSALLAGLAICVAALEFATMLVSLILYKN